VKTVRKAFSEKRSSRSPASQSEVVSTEHLPVLFSCQWLSNVAFMPNSNSTGNIFPLIDRQWASRRTYTAKRRKQILYQSSASNLQEWVLRAVVLFKHIQSPGEPELTR